MSRRARFWLAVPQLAIEVPLGIGVVELLLWLRKP